MARMVDVSEKEPTLREAVAKARLRVSEDVAESLRAGELPKGDAVEAARIAGIMAAKKTPELIPLCHPIELAQVKVEVELKEREAEVRAEVRAFSRTGVEMEALVAAAVAALTLYDMVKGIDRGAEITEVCLLEKRGGKSGTWRKDEGKGGIGQHEPEERGVQGPGSGDRAQGRLGAGGGCARRPGEEASEPLSLGGDTAAEGDPALRRQVLSQGARCGDRPRCLRRESDH
ncbi:MAG TPA: cyclic pyranopterin monophosphate synthase MoaC [Candidatus Latescibacteria bacterium]|nr:cyclic pyranopterin monophosphate synthase MoaC [Candidatus Latescibacterota bacterium]